jgi:7,8-dihydropterin-6-yl-methyl-4-(beta-D-ribofuranosyl)aminobenzene 5'-phosphate synthase
MEAVALSLLRGHRIIRQYMKTIWVTVLVDDSVQGRSLQAEHGLSFFIRTDRQCVLFDTGQTDLLLRNAGVLDVSLADLQAIAISHGHYDHTGGLKTAREQAPQSRLYLHPAAVAPKFAGNPDGSSRNIGMIDPVLETVRQAGDAVVWTTKPTQIADGIFLTGEIPRRTSFEDTGGRFFLDEVCARPDPLIDDQALFFDTQEGVVMLVGCAHAGLVNTVEYVRHITGHRPIHAVLGGFHLLEAGAERIGKTLEAIQRWDPQRIAPGHCTGMPALARLWSALPDRCSTCAVGASIGFERRSGKP